MPEVPPIRQPSLTRRQGLTAVALLGPVGLLAACSSDEPTSAPSDPASSAQPAPGDPAADVSAGEQELIALYDGVIGAFPALGATLEAIRDEHRQHAAALAATAVPSAAVVTAPASRSAALRLLIAAEREAMHSRIAASVAAPDPALARTLAFIAASEGSHVPALRDLRA